MNRAASSRAPVCEGPASARHRGFVYVKTRVRMRTHTYAAKRARRCTRRRDTRRGSRRGQINETHASSGTQFARGSIRECPTLRILKSLENLLHCIFLE